MSTECGVLSWEGLKDPGDDKRNCVFASQDGCYWENMGQGTYMFAWSLV